MEIICKKIIVKGIVQGVGYRYSAHKFAKQVGVKGFVKNQADGSVLILAEGTRDQINKLIKWCYEGPSRSRVSDVLLFDNRLEGFENFSVRY